MKYKDFRYKEAERRLKVHEQEKIYLNALKEQLELFELEYELSGINYEGMRYSGNISDTTGEKAVNMAENKQRKMLELEIKQTTQRVEHIEKIINSLTDTERQIIILYYMRHKNLQEIVQVVGYSRSQVAKIKSDAMKKIIVGLFGDNKKD